MTTPQPSKPLPSTTTPPPLPALISPSKWQRLMSLWQTYGARANAALDRAEQCVTAHFKVPPNGG